MIEHLLPLQIALLKSYLNIARILLEHDPTLVNCVYTLQSREFPLGDKTAFQLGAMWGDMSILQFLLPFNPDPHRVCVEGKSALDYAVDNGHYACADLIYEYMIERDFEMNSCTL
jgi:ankyrin repeat protein